MVKGEEDLYKFINQSIYGNKIVIGMGAGSISSWMRNLKNKIMFLYKNPASCQEMGKSAKYKASTYFSWELYGKNVIETYQKLLLKK